MATSDTEGWFDEPGLLAVSRSSSVVQMIELFSTPCKAWNSREKKMRNR